MELPAPPLRLLQPLHLLDLPVLALSCIIQDHLGREGRLALFQVCRPAAAQGPPTSMLMANVPQVSYSARRLVLSHTKKVYIAPRPGSNTGALAQLLKLPPGLL
jgi:hypothetical protein